MVNPALSGTRLHVKSPVSETAGKERYAAPTGDASLGNNIILRPKGVTRGHNFPGVEKF